MSTIIEMSRRYVLCRISRNTPRVPDHVASQAWWWSVLPSSISVSLVAATISCIFTETECELSFIRNLYCKEDLLPNLSWRESSIQESCLAEWDHFLFSVLVAGWVVAGPSLSVTFQSDVNVTNSEGGGGRHNINMEVQSRDAQNVSFSMVEWHQTIGEHSSRYFANTITKHTVMGSLQSTYTC